MAGTTVSLISIFQIIASQKDKPANHYKRTCQVPYTPFLSDLQRDSDEEQRDVAVELPRQENSSSYLGFYPCIF